MGDEGGAGRKQGCIPQCLPPQHSNREGGGVWIEPQDKKHVAADGGDQNKQLCPQENELHIPFSDPTPIPTPHKSPHPHACSLSIPAATGASPPALARLPGAAFVPTPSPLDRGAGAALQLSGSEYSGQVAGGGWRGASSRASLHLPGQATLRLFPEPLKKSWEQRRARLCGESGEVEAGPGAWAEAGSVEIWPAHSGWALTFRNSQKGRQQAQDRPPRWLMRAHTLA